MLLVAVIVMEPVETGALNNPLALMVPPLADQFTEALVPACAVALHCEVPFGATVAGLHATLMAPAAAVVDDGLPPPPQAVSKIRTKLRMRPGLNVNPGNSFFISHRKVRGKRAILINRGLRICKRACQVRTQEAKIVPDRAQGRSLEGKEMTLQLLSETTLGAPARFAIRM